MYRPRELDGKSFLAEVKSVSRSTWPPAAGRCYRRWLGENDGERTTGDEARKVKELLHLRKQMRVLLAELDANEKAANHVQQRNEAGTAVRYAAGRIQNMFRKKTSLGTRNDRGPCQNASAGFEKCAKRSMNRRLRSLTQRLRRLEDCLVAADSAKGMRIKPPRETDSEIGRMIDDDSLKRPPQLADGAQRHSVEPFYGKKGTKKNAVAPAENA